MGQRCKTHEDQATQITTEIKTLQELASRTEERDGKKIPYEVLNPLLQSVLEYLAVNMTVRCNSSTIAEALKSIQARLDQIETPVHQPRIYVEAAARATHPIKQQPSPNSHSQRQQEEILIRIQDGKEREDTQRTPTIELVKRLQGEKKEATQQLVALRWLPGEDILVHAATPEARETLLERSQEWVKRVASSATVIRKGYPILAHGVRIEAVQTEDQERVIRTLTEQNATLHPGLQITRVAWPK